MSEIVPWTDPGGTPCCCEEECFTDFANEPKPTYAENSFSAITSADYTALYAGGTYTASVELDIEGWRDGVVLTTPLSVFRSTERHYFSGSNIELAQILTSDGPCYERYSGEITISREWVTSTGSATSTYGSPLVFARSLGTEAGQRRLSLASVYGPSSNQSINEILSLDGFVSAFPVSIAMRSGNMTNTVPYNCSGAATYSPNLSKVASSMALSVVGGGTYTAYGVVAHPCFQTAGHFNQVINGQFLTSFGFELYADVEGSVDVQVVFSPSAP